MNATNASVCLLTSCLLCSQIALAEEKPPDIVPALMAGAELSPSTARPWVSAGAGCLGGAALGTVLPGIGNLIGCIAGGASVWWLRRSTAR